jgi:hypothetical protein
MASTRRRSRAERAASNAWLGADGGCIFADAPNAVTSAAAIVHQVSMHRNITPLRVIRSSQASSRASGGFTIIVLRNSSPAQSFPLLTRIRWSNPCLDRPERCLQTGKRCFTNKGVVASPKSICRNLLRRISQCLRERAASTKKRGRTMRCLVVACMQLSLLVVVTSSWSASVHSISYCTQADFMDRDHPEQQEALCLQSLTLCESAGQCSKPQSR